MAHLFTVAPVSITANPQTVALPSSVPAGSLIVVHVAQFYGANPPRAIASVADSVNSGNYALTDFEATDGGIPVAIFHKVAGATGTPTVSVSFTGGIPNGSISVSVYDGEHTVVGPTAKASTTGSTSSPGAVDTGASSALRISMYGTYSNYYTLTDTGSGTPRAFQSINAAAPNNVYVADRVASGSVAHSIGFDPANSASALTVTFTGAAPTPATLSGAGRDTITSTSARITASSDKAGTTFFVAVSTSATPPTAAQIKAGSGGSIVAAASSALVSGANAATVSGLSPSTTYYGYAVATNAAGDSNVVATTSFTTSAPPPAPVLTSPNRSSVTATSVGINATSDLSGGTLYVAVSTSATPPSAAQIKAGSGGSIVAANSAALAAGANAVAVSGLTPNTVYYGYAVAENGTGFSNVVATPSFTTSALTPAVSATSSANPAREASLTITGTNFGASQGSGGVTIGGVAQTVTAWSDTSITVTVNRGSNRYGVGLNLVVTNGTGGTSAPFALTSIQPQAGWQYVNVGTPATDASTRLTATPALATGDQVAWGAAAGTGSVTVAADLTFAADAGVTAFSVEAWNPTDGWGDVAVQALGSAAGRVAAVLAAIL